MKTARWATQAAAVQLSGLAASQQATATLDAVERGAGWQAALRPDNLYATEAEDEDAADGVVRHWATSWGLREGDLAWQILDFLAHDGVPIHARCRDWIMHTAGRWNLPCVPPAAAANAEEDDGARAVAAAQQTASSPFRCPWGGVRVGVHVQGSACAAAGAPCTLPHRRGIVAQPPSPGRTQSGANLARGPAHGCVSRPHDVVAQARDLRWHPGRVHGRLAGIAQMN